MANQKHVDRLNKDVEKWNRWRAKNKETLPDLSGADLSGVDLSGVDLSGVDLHWANLSGTDLHRANLSRANLARADLGAADLSGADLSSANLTSANLSSAILSSAILSKMVLGGTVFFNTDLTDALDLESCDHLLPSNVDHITLENSGMLPEIFLRGCGLPDKLIDYYPSLLNQSISYYSCFISYSHNDKVFARRLHDQLQGRGIRCWLDEHQVLPGDDIYQQVDEGIRLWDKVLLCASEKSLTSWWVDNEINSAFNKEQKLYKQRGKKIWSLVPLDLDGYMFGTEWNSGKAEQVKSRLAAKFKGWETDNALFEEAFENVIKALQTDGTGREQPPESKL